MFAHPGNGEAKYGSRFSENVQGTGGHPIGDFLHQYAVSVPYLSIFSLPLSVICSRRELHLDCVCSDGYESISRLPGLCLDLP